jgi:hypothetical protein
MTPSPLLGRRSFLQGMAVAPWLPTAVSLAGCAEASDALAPLDQAWADTWVATDPARDGLHPDALTLNRELVRCATLAPSSHNTQCWRFGITESAITIAPDLSRRCPAVDPYDHHLFVSLGCAAENLVQAALAHGYAARVHVAETAPDTVDIALEPTKPVTTALAAVIAQRQCTRTDYDGRPLDPDELTLLATASTGAGVRPMLITTKQAIEDMLALVVEGNSVQFGDAAFMAELKSWIRFSDAEALRTRDGLHSRTSGHGSVPQWLGSAMFPLVFREGAENDKLAQQVRSSAGIVVFVSQADDTAHRVEVGRCYQRFALQATALGIRNAMLNQAVEVPAVRGALTRHLGLTTEHPDLVVRFGRAPLAPRSLRRPVGAVLA